ncbi:MAG: hypothetical protein ACYSOF_00645, partial [Planctomycetota bacterium]
SKNFYQSPDSNRAGLQIRAATVMERAGTRAESSQNKKKNAIHSLSIYRRYQLIINANTNGEFS